jgi:hypothetical protein
MSGPTQPRRGVEHLITASWRLGMRDTCLSTSTVLTFTRLALQPGHDLI